jgi:putative methyltransferase (TIGR04325 family)
MAPLPAWMRRFAGAPAGGTQFLGNYASWEAARRDSSGYDAPRILEKTLQAILKVKSGAAAGERDSVLFDRIQYSYPLLAALLLACAREGRLSVLDFGGALGSSYFQNRGMLAHARDLRWGVVEQAHVAACGRSRVAEGPLAFFDTVEACIGAIAPNFALLSSVLSYLEKPLPLLDEILARGLPFVCLDRNLVSLEGGSRLTVQVVPPSIYEASYPCWIIDEKEFLARGSGAYRLAYDFDARDGGEVRLDGLRGKFKGYLYVRGDLAAPLGIR